MGMPSNAPSTNSAEQAAIQSFGLRLAQLKDDLAMNLDRMERILTRAFGSEPTATAGAASTPLRSLPNGEIASVSERLDDIFNISHQQSSVLNRLDTIV